MLELFDRPPSRAPQRGALPLLVSTIVHAAALALLVVVPYLYVTEQMPQVPSMMTFVVEAPALAPPPPPPPPGMAARRPATPVDPTRTAQKPLAPVEAPVAIVPESALLPQDEGVEGGVMGGIEGGVVGGAIGGVLGGLVEAPAPPPPPPVPDAPVRIGGQIQAPALVRRVEPVYPAIARTLQFEGLVILEATVDTAGAVDAVRVLRSAGPALDRAAVDAVQQWQYKPLLLNGRAERFVLTETLSFNLRRATS